MIESGLKWVIQIPEKARLPPDIVARVRELEPIYSDEYAVTITYQPKVSWEAQGNTNRIRAILNAVPREWVTERPTREEIEEALGLLYDITASWERWLIEDE